MDNNVINEENMISSFPDLGITGSESVSTTDQKLDKIIKNQEKMISILQGKNLEKEETVTIPEPVKEETVSEIVDDPVETIKSETFVEPPIVEQPISLENESVPKQEDFTSTPEVEEEVKEEPFNPVNVDTINEEPLDVPNITELTDSKPLDIPTIEEQKNNESPKSAFTSIDEILSAVDEKLEQESVETLTSEINDTEEPKVISMSSIIKEQPVVEQPVIRPMVEAKEEIPVETIVAPEEKNIPEVVPEVSTNVTPTVQTEKKDFKDVTELFAGMTSVSTEGQHRTLLVTDNEKFQQVKQDEKTLVMSNAA